MRLNLLKTHLLMEQSSGKDGMMSKNEAISMLDQAVSQLQVSREVHVKLQQAVQIIKDEFDKEDAKNKK